LQLVFFFLEILFFNKSIASKPSTYIELSFEPLTPFFITDKLLFG